MARDEASYDTSLCPVCQSLSWVLIFLFMSSPSSSAAVAFTLWPFYCLRQTVLRIRNFSAMVYGSDHLLLYPTLLSTRTTKSFKYFLLFLSVFLYLFEKVESGSNQNSTELATTQPQTMHLLFTHIDWNVFFQNLEDLDPLWVSWTVLLNTQVSPSIQFCGSGSFFTGSGSDFFLSRELYIFVIQKFRFFYSGWFRFISIIKCYSARIAENKPDPDL